MDYFFVLIDKGGSFKLFSNLSRLFQSNMGLFLSQCFYKQNTESDFLVILLLYQLMNIDKKIRK